MKTEHCRTTLLRGDKGVYLSLLTQRMQHNKHKRILFLLANMLFSSVCLFAQTAFEPPQLTCVRNTATAPAGTELNWNLPATPNPCFTGYEIYTSETGINGTYTLYSTVSNPLQTSVVLPINKDRTAPATINYFYIINRGSCTNPTTLTRTTSDTLSNQKPQPFTGITSASVINNQVHITWIPAPSIEVIGYLVYNNADGYVNADTVWGRLNTTLIDTTNDPSAFAITYKIRTLEFCEDVAGLQGSITPDSAEHKTILLRLMEVDTCSQAASIQWSAYKIGTAAVINYEVQTSINGASFTISSVQSNTTSNFLLTNIPYQQTVCVRIKANLPNGSFAFSNEQCFSANAIQKPKDDYIRNISVENGVIQIEYVYDSIAAPPQTIALYKSSNGIEFIPKTTFDSIRLRPFVLQINEPGLDVAGTNYSYFLSLIDLCDNRHFSDTATTLRIAAKAKSNNKVDIGWSGFAIENSDFVQFRLEKIVGTDTTLVGYFDRDEYKFTDNNLFDYTKDTVLDACFRITAEFYNLNDKTPREKLESHSNIFCLTPEPQFFIPQAFRPDGYNRTIRPLILMASPDGYKFTVFDRWHEEVFSTGNITDAWDGTYKGDKAPLDGYLYYVEYTGRNGVKYTQSGTFVLIR